MSRVIECGEKTVQKLGRISIADVMQSNGIEPGDVVIVDIRVPYSISDAADLKSLRKYACEDIIHTILARRIVKEILHTNEETKELSDDSMIIESVNTLDSVLKENIRSIKLRYDLTAKDVKDAAIEYYGCLDEDEESDYDDIDVESSKINDD